MSNSNEKEVPTIKDNSNHKKNQDCIELKNIQYKTMLEKGILDTQYELPTYREKGVKQVVISIETMKGGEPLLIYEKASSE